MADEKIKSLKEFVCEIEQSIEKDEKLDPEKTKNRLEMLHEVIRELEVADETIS